MNEYDVMKSPGVMVALALRRTLRELDYDFTEIRRIEAMLFVVLGQMLRELAEEEEGTPRRLDA